MDEMEEEMLQQKIRVNITNSSFDSLNIFPK